MRIALLNKYVSAIFCSLSYLEIGKFCVRP